MSLSFITPKIKPHCIIQLVIILIQLSGSYGYPARYEIRDYHFYGPPHVSNMGPCINGVYTRLPEDEHINAQLRTELNREWNFRRLHPEHVARYSHNNSSNCEFFAVKGSGKYKWCLRTVDPSTRSVRRTCGNNSFINSLFTVDNDHERFAVVDFLSLEENIKTNRQRVDQLEERELYPYYPPEYRIDLRCFGIITQEKKYSDTRGLYQKNTEDDHQIQPGLLRQLTDAWESEEALDSDDVIYQYNHQENNGYALFIMDSEDKERGYKWALLTPHGLKYGSAHTSHFFVHHELTIELMIYDSSIKMRPIGQMQNISIQTIYVMMALSVCFVLMVLAMIIKTRCLFAQTMEIPQNTSPYNIRMF